MSDAVSARPRDSAAILGLGLIGGSIGMALRSAGWRIAGFDPNPSAREDALLTGAADAVFETSPEAIAAADLVVLACPLGAMPALFRDLEPLAARAGVVTDAGSVKSTVVAEGERAFGGRFVGGHPMAGSEQSGIAAARADLFYGAPWLLTPTNRTDTRSLASVRRLVEACGAKPFECSPENHDRWVARVSHLTHLAAFGVAQTAASSLPEEAREIAANSFRDVTRIAAAEPALWSGILMENREEVAQAIDGLIEWLGRVRSHLDRNGMEELQSQLDMARTAKRSFSR